MNRSARFPAAPSARPCLRVRHPARLPLASELRRGRSRNGRQVVHDGDAYRAAAAYARPSARRSWKVTGAILPRVFRHRVRVAARHHEHFEPRSGCRVESAIRRASGDRVRAPVAFPAAASAAVDRYASPSFAVAASAFVGYFVELALSGGKYSRSLIRQPCGVFTYVSS